MIGRTIGNYRIVEKLGEGGMGAVYRATDIMLERDTAIKVLRPDLAGEPEIVERFRSEAITLARLQHPNIATLYSLTREANDLMMVMEFVRGETLERVLARAGAIAAGTAITWGCQVLDAMDYAHRKGVVHRDIKPANVMITEEGEVKVTDFGIARVLGESRKTRTGHIIGTIAYMAPEQIRGHDVDARTDLYALGILLFELLTGRLPFDADTDFSLMMAQVNQPPPPARSFSAGVPEWLDQSIQRALAKAPAERFQTAREFKAVLQSGLRLTPLAGEARPVFDTPTVAIPAGSSLFGTSGALPRESAGLAAESAVSARPVVPPSLPEATPPPPGPTSLLSPAVPGTSAGSQPSVGMSVDLPLAGHATRPAGEGAAGLPGPIVPADASQEVAGPEEPATLGWRFWAAAAALSVLTVVAAWVWLGPAVASWRAGPVQGTADASSAAPEETVASQPPDVSAVEGAQSAEVSGPPRAPVQAAGSASVVSPPPATPGVPTASPVPSPPASQTFGGATPLGASPPAPTPSGQPLQPPGERATGRSGVTPPATSDFRPATPSPGTPALPAVPTGRTTPPPVAGRAATPGVPSASPATPVITPTPSPTPPAGTPAATPPKPAVTETKPDGANVKPVTPARPDATFEDTVWVFRQDDEDVEADVILEFRPGGLLMQPDDEEIAARTITYRAVTGLAYSQNKPSTVGRIFFQRTSHWLTISARTGDVLLQLDGGNYKEILAELEARTGLTSGVK